MIIVFSFQCPSDHPESSGYRKYRPDALAKAPVLWYNHYGFEGGIYIPDRILQT